MSSTALQWSSSKRTTQPSIQARTSAILVRPIQSSHDSDTLTSLVKNPAVAVASAGKQKPDMSGAKTLEQRQQKIQDLKKNLEAKQDGVQGKQEQNIQELKAEMTQIKELLGTLCKGD